MITIQKFGTLADGKDVRIFTLNAPNGLSVSLLNYGATLQSFRLPSGQDIVLGFEGLEPYLGEHPYFGAAIGRVSNRIARAKFSVDSQTYKVNANEKNNALHSGPNGFERQLWNYSIQEKENSVSFHHNSPSGHQGYPGLLSVTFTYHLSDKGLRLDMRATTDAATPVSLTNHSYFNLSGSIIDDHALSIDSDSFYQTDHNNINMGQCVNVANGNLDFSSARKIMTTAMDNHFIVNGTTLREMIKLYSPDGTIALKLSSDLPGVQVYTGDGIDPQTGKSEAFYTKRSGIAFEPQYPPNAVNLPQLPNVILRPQDIWQHSILYEVSFL